MAHEVLNLALICTIMNTPKIEIVYEAIELLHWKSTMEDEYDALMKNGTWKLVDLPLRKNAIRCKWMFKMKYKVDGTVDKHKA